MHLRAVLLAALLLVSSVAFGAPIGFYPSLSGQSSGDTGEGRWTYFQLLNNVTVTALGVALDPASSTDRFRWEIYSVDTSGVLQSTIFQTTVLFADDDALSVKDTVVDIDLSVGNYVLGLTTLDAPWQILGGPNSVSGGYFGPGFITVDGNFRLWDAAASSPSAPLQPGNSGLIPGFSVNIEGYLPDSNRVPEPGTLALLALGLAGLCYSRHRTTDNKASA